MSFSKPHEEAHDAWGEERSRFLNELGIDAEAAFLSEETAPPIDRDQLFALAKRELREPEARRVCELMASYRSWRDAFGAVLLELSEHGESES